MIRFLLFSLLLSAWVSAAIDPTMVWHIRQDAQLGNVNGGGFKPGATGTDYSTQALPQYPLTGVTTAAADAILLSAFAADDMVGNVAHITGGTNFTAGWYEIISVVVGASITLDRACTTAAGAGGVVNIGGALSMQGTLDDDFFDFPTAGNTINVKSGTYVLGEAVAVLATGTAILPIKLRGFTSTPGDACTGTNRPTWNAGVNSFSLAANWDVYNLIVTGGGSNQFLIGAAGKAKNCKAVNSSSSADRSAFNLSADAMLVDCEAICYRGYGVLCNTTTASVLNCYIHDCNVGITSASTSAPVFFTNNIIESCVTGAIRGSGANVGVSIIYGNTLFGSTNTTGYGISFATGTTDARVINNIITGFATGIVHADAQSVGYDNFNDYHNNDADVSAAGQWQKGPNDQAIAPAFASVGQVTGATGTTTATNHLIQSGATFVTSGVTAGRDFVYIISGTGLTSGPGIYGIASVDSETQLTTDITLTASASSVVFQITTGRNFSPGAALKALGAPAGFQGGYSTGYVEPGAVQRQELGGGQTSSAGVK